jgi:hypothetical protein
VSEADFGLVALSGDFKTMSVPFHSVLSLVKLK